MFIAEKRKRNIERMCEVNGDDYQGQQQFITDSPWSALEAMKIVAKKANMTLGETSGQVLLIDESSSKKAGKHSVGVSRQHNGNLGKIENSQTGVYAALAKDEHFCLVRSKLFLPEEWIADEKRCLQAGIPKSEILFKTKPQLAIEMIKELDGEGISYGWMGADALYGRNYEFRDALHKIGKKYVVDIQRDHCIYLERPHIYIPKSKTGRGRKNIHYVTDNESITVESYKKSLEEKDWEKIQYRKGTKSPIEAHYHVREVWVWKQGTQDSQRLTLIIKRTNGGLKYGLSNFSISEVSKEQLAYMQGQRHLVESSFKDSKGELGLFDYQIRKYRSWYHHNALVMMAMHFVLETIIKNNVEQPLLSVRDVRLQIIAILKDNGVLIEKEISQMKTRHKQRAYDILRRYNLTHHLII